MKNRPKKTTSAFTPAEQWENFCEAMAEQVLLDGGAFPNAKDVADVHKELERLANQIATEEADPQPPEPMNTEADARDGQTPEHQPSEATQNKNTDFDPFTVGGLRYCIIGGVGVWLVAPIADVVCPRPNLPHSTPKEQQTRKKSLSKSRQPKKNKTYRSGFRSTLNALRRLFASSSTKGRSTFFNSSCTSSASLAFGNAPASSNSCSAMASQKFFHCSLGVNGFRWCSFRASGGTNRGPGGFLLSLLSSPITGPS